MVSVVAGLAASLYDFGINHRLPQPFYFGLNESLTDWFVTAQFAHQSGAYDRFIFSSIYPPISFVFLKFTSLASCYGQDAYYARDCDTLARVTIVLSYLGSCAIAGWAFWKNDRATGAMRGLAFALCFPLLFALERGNTIMVAFICFVVGYGGVYKSRFAQVLGIALALNLKPYLLAPAAADVLKRNWRLAEQVAIGTALVYALSYAIFADGDPFVLLNNISFFADATVSYIWERIYYATSLESFSYFNSYRFPTRDFIDGRIIDMGYIVIYAVMYTSVALLMLSSAVAWFRPDAISRMRIMLFLLCLHLVTAAEGGYLFLFVIFMVFMERSQSKLTRVAVVIAYLQCIPYDLVLSHFITLDGDSWLSGYTASFSIGPAVGMFLRPLLLNILVWALTIDSLLTVTKSWRGNPPVLWLARPRRMTA